MTTEDIFALMDDAAEGSGLTSEFGPPTIAWGVGDAKLAQRGIESVEAYGGWQVGLENIRFDAGNMLATGWMEDSFTNQRSELVECLSAPKLNIALIRYRMRWVAKVGDTEYYHPWSGGWEALSEQYGSARGQVHFLCRVQGMENEGAIVLSLRGHSQQSLVGSPKKYPNGVLPTVKRLLSNPMNQQAKKRGTKQGWAPLAFWAPVGVRFIEETKGKGKAAVTTRVPEFIEVGSNAKSSIVLPNWVGPDEVEDPMEYFVGAEIWKENNELFREFEDWERAWDDEMEASDADYHDDGEDETVTAVSMDEADLEALDDDEGFEV